VRNLTDPRDLRAVAHPVRMAILEQLQLGGPMTASRLGDRIDETPANCSWHLRKLAEHGFVEEAGGGRGRERPWQATDVGMRWSDTEAGPEARIAGEALAHVVLERELGRLADARSRLHDDAPEWKQAAFTNQSMLWLTAEELAEVSQVVEQLYTSRLDRLGDPAKRPPGSRLCALMAWGMPTYDLAEPTAERTAEPTAEPTSTADEREQP
jgi:DNA-binding transcriptional ArsR family regulator